jgi:hypothetical protein
MCLTACGTYFFIKELNMATVTNQPILIEIESTTKEKKIFTPLTTGDTSAYPVTIKFTDLDSSVDMATHCNLCFKRYDGQITNVSTDSLDGNGDPKVVISKNTVSYTLEPGIYAVEGLLEMWVQFGDPVIYTPVTIKFLAIRTLPSGTPITDLTPYPDWLQAIADANAAALLATTAASNADIATGNAEQATEDAVTATGLANDAADLANSKASLADSKATLANDAANNADTATGLTNAAILNANNAADNANGKATLADQKATLADQKAALANDAAVSANAAAGTATTATNTANTFVSNNSLLEAYNAGHAYVVGNKVTYLGSTYQCILASTGNLPTNGTYWICIAQIGDAGTITAGSTNTAISGLVAGNGSKISTPTAAQVGALPITDTNSFYTVDTIQGVADQCSAQLATIGDISAALAAIVG